MVMKGWSPLIYSAIFVAVIVSMWGTGFFDLNRLTRASMNLATFSRELFPPNFRIVGDVYFAVFETLQMAFLGTMLGFATALPLAMLSARNLFGRATTTLARLFLSVVRTIPALLWAIIFVVTVGLGPLAGTLGLAVYSLGYLGKLYYESLESVDPEVIEAVKSTGCSTIQLIRYAVIPESANHILSQLLFMFEYNVRASAILGFVGAGGIGFYILGYIQVLQYRNLMALILLTLAIVLLIDYGSSKIRSRFLIMTPR